MAEERYGSESLKAHAAWRGKIELLPRVGVETREELALAYTPGVAAPCLEIARHPERSYRYTRRWNLCLVVTDGSAVLGLGDIGPEAAMPVMEGKCVLFKAYGGVDAFPLCLKTRNVDEIVRTLYLLSGSFGGINLEDIAAPRCFEIEARLRDLCEIPVFHDDQHGTAIVVLAALINALKVTGRRIDQTRVVISGAGAASLATARFLLKTGVRDLLICDRQGILYPGRPGMNRQKEELAALSNPEASRGSLADALKGADVLIGLSGPGLVSGPMVRSMAADPIVFACANPEPEIDPAEALEAGAAVVATGRSDYPNQINNVLAFPAVFRGCFDVGACEINHQMKEAAARSIASLVAVESLSRQFILPEPMDPRLRKIVAGAVSRAAVTTGVARGER